MTLRIHKRLPLINFLKRIAQMMSKVCSILVNRALRTLKNFFPEIFLPYLHPKYLKEGFLIFLPSRFEKQNHSLIFIFFTYFSLHKAPIAPS